jgi:dihydroorotate dehydrogenase
VYRLLYALVFRRIDAETAHRIGFWLIRTAAALPGGTRLLRRTLAPRDPALRVKALGLDFPSPLGLAAGFDKNGEGAVPLAALGFGFVEVGTVTARPQLGNPRPRLFRFSSERALVNRMGFNNSGAVAVAARLRSARVRAARRGAGLRGAWPVTGVNIGKTKMVAEDDASADYVASARAVADVADYVVVNVSSPNTPGLRDLQAVDLLRPLLVAVRTALDEASSGRRVPLLVKIAPDLSDSDIDAVADLARDLGLDGIIATNTTISREGLGDAAAVAAAGAGGMSGAPLKERALEVLRRLRERTGDQLVLIAAGGISDAADAAERLDAGATLVQAYTAFIYGGPFWPRRVNADLAARGTSISGECTRDGGEAGSGYGGWRPATGRRGGGRRGRGLRRSG